VLPRFALFRFVSQKEGIGLQNRVTKAEPFACAESAYFLPSPRHPCRPRGQFTEFFARFVAFFIIFIALCRGHPSLPR
jgi:hypothetical protein